MNLKKRCVVSHSLWLVLILGVIEMSLPTKSLAQEKLSAFKNKVEGGYDFWLHEPDLRTVSNQPIPLILFLHGKSLSGSNLEQVKRYGVLKEVLRRRKLPAYVIAPQCPRGKMWNPERIIKVVDFIQHNYSTDTNRFYVVGMSMGGYGVLHFAGAFSERIAAAVALCGGGKEGDGCKLATIPLWIMHGTSDRAVSYKESEKMVNSIKRVNNGANLKYDFIAGAGHGEMARFFSMDELYSWLFSHSKSNPTLASNDSVFVDHSRFVSSGRKHKGKRAKSRKLKINKRKHHNSH
jgi:predicted peptidase